jgi:hypothetical protein
VVEKIIFHGFDEKEIKMNKYLSIYLRAKIKKSTWSKSRRCINHVHLMIKVENTRRQTLSEPKSHSYHLNNSSRPMSKFRYM